jgi:hypothetical protein
MLTALLFVLAGGMLLGLGVLAHLTRGQLTRTARLAMRDCQEG